MMARVGRAVTNAAAGAPLRAVATRVRHDIRRSVGQPLDGALRDRMEARVAGTERLLPAGAACGFHGLEAAADAAAGDGRGRTGEESDFSNVRLHTDGYAASAARRLGAGAFTIGDHVYADPKLASAGPSVPPSLLAHELAHVVQQRQLNRQMIQPRLIVTGSDADIRRFIALTEPAMGDYMQHDATTGRISTTGPFPSTRRSPAFAAMMRRIIDDPRQHCLAHIGVGQIQVLGGAFPAVEDMTGASTAQDIDIDDFEAIETGAPGSGIALLAHELIENYEAHGMPAVRGLSRKDAAHDLALATEAEVAGETVGRAGRRVAQASVIAGTTETIAWDYESYYLILVPNTDPTSGNVTITNARHAPRINLVTRTIDHYDTNSSEIPLEGGPAIADAAAAVAANDLATVRIEAFTDSVGTKARNTILSNERAKDALLELAISGVAQGRVHKVARGEDEPVAPNDSEANRARNRRVVITVDRPGP